jgi:Phytanoyl-CoA dioxygenase (PhyH)
MRKVFSDPEMNSLFLKKGYVIIDLMDQDQCDGALLMYEKLHSNFASDKFFTTTNSLDSSYRHHCNDYLAGLIMPMVKDLFDDYLPLFGNFMIKPPSLGSECNLHQDWTFVDESEFRTVNVWVALQDTDQHNGCIHVIPGSQNISFPIRGRNIKRAYENAIQSMVDSMMEAVPLRKGQAVIFDSSILHYSPPNRSDKVRIALSLMFYPADAKLVHFVYSKDNSEQIAKYNVDVEFFVKFAADEDYVSANAIKLKIPQMNTSIDWIKSELAKLS